MAWQRWEYVNDPIADEPWFDRDWYANRDAHAKVSDLERSQQGEVYRALMVLPVGYHAARTIAQRCQTLSPDDVLRFLNADVRVHGDRSAFRERASRFTLSRREHAAIETVLITPAYRQLGLSMLHPLFAKFIPAAAEINFFVPKPSLIQGGGTGLFLRSGRVLRKGVIACEYRGENRKKVSLLQSRYTVRTQESTMICALADDGQLTCWAALINDAGLAAANIEFHDFADFPGRVFLVCLRDISGGEEFYAAYGARYWGATTYSNVKVSRAVNTFEYIDKKCRTCREYFPKTVWNIHREYCCGEITGPLRDLDCLPYNEFTTYTPQRGCTTSEDTDARRRAAHFVTGDLYSCTFTREELESDDETRRPLRPLVAL